MAAVRPHTVHGTCVFDRKPSGLDSGASDPPRLKQFSHQIGHGLVAPPREKVALQGRCCHCRATPGRATGFVLRRSLHVLRVVECVPRLAGRSLSQSLIFKFL